MDHGIRDALKTGVKLLQSETIATPNAWNRDLSLLENLLIQLLNEQIELRGKAEPAPTPAPPTAPMPTPPDPK